MPLWANLKIRVVKKFCWELFYLTVIQQAALKDDYTNYDYLEVIWRPHSTLGQCSDMMIPSKDSKMHLERAQAINGVTTVYRCQLAFSGKNVSLSGRTQVINGNAVDAVEEHILRVIGY